MRCLLIYLTLAAACTAAAIAPARGADSVRVLLVTGLDDSGHRWKETAPAIRKVLEQDKRIDVRIVEDPEFLASSAIADYDVIFLHFSLDSRKQLSRERQIRENLSNFVKQGKGLFVFHFACGAFADWPEFASLAGKVWDKKTTHDPRGPFQVRIVEKNHPITRGMRDFQADDELYICLTGERPVTVLATARSKLTHKEHPMSFVFDYGKGRVFHTPLGHDVRSIEMPGVAELIRRGCLWTAKKLP
jgi:uncharacterized protein